MDEDDKTKEKERLLQETGRTSSSIDEYGGMCCHPGSTGYRYTVLIMLCLTGVGDYFVLDNPAALEDHILKDLDIGVAKYMLFYSSLQWAQIVACVVSGYLIDKVLGNRWSMLIGCFIVTVSQIYLVFPSQVGEGLEVIFGLGAQFGNFIIMCFGRTVFGLLEASFGTAVNNMAVRWFKSKELNMVLGLKTSIARAGSVIQMNVMGPIYNYMSDHFNGKTSLALTLYVGAGICLLSALCAVILFFMDKYGDNYCLNKELLETKGRDVKVSDIKEFPLTFWLASLVISCYYWGVFTFVGIGVVYFEMKYEQEPAVAANVNSLAYLISIFALPICGWLIDKLGRSLYWLFLGLILGLLSHITLAFTFLNPYIAMSLLGVSYSITTATIWPMVPYMVELKYCATAFGLMNAIIAIGQSGVTYLAGYLADHSGYLVVEVLFIAGMCVSLILSCLIYIIDSSQGGVLNLSVEERKKRLYKHDSPSKTKSEESQH